jgi:hypothetical protein
MVDEDAKQYLRDMTDIVMEFRRNLSDETDRGCALMAAEFISNQLGELLRAYFVDDEKACNSALDDPSGSLSALSARIEFAYLPMRFSPGPPAHRKPFRFRSPRAAPGQPASPSEFRYLLLSRLWRYRYRRRNPVPGAVSIFARQCSYILTSVTRRMNCNGITTWPVIVCFEP